jgi:hypothetical protein
LSKGTSQNKKKQKSSSKKSSQQKPSRIFLIAAAVIIIVVAIAAGLIISGHHGSGSSSSTNSVSNGYKPMILYVNQGNALVDMSNFSNLLNFARTQHFNTIFFQVYRSGQLLFSNGNLSAFVVRAQLEGMSIYYSLYFTASTQQIPSSLYIFGENGINLDMSTLSTSAQASLLATLSKNYHGNISVTTTDFTTTLKPNLLVFETYNSPQDNQYIHSGIIASVEPLGITSEKEYEQQYQYALSNSDGVMVFDYYGLLKTGYSSNSTVS